jgi:hypothetical protein
MVSSWTVYNRVLANYVNCSVENRCPFLNGRKEARKVVEVGSLYPGIPGRGMESADGK